MSDSDDGRRRAADSSTTGESDEVAVERLPPDEAFELLAHETRFRILETLNETDGSLAFSELRERVGVDDPGQFNYHLGKLTDRFVTSSDEGYELAAPGWRVVGAVLSGGYTKALDADPIETDVPCLSCESGMELRFRGEKVQIQCPECDETYTNIPIPAGIFEGVSPDEAPGVVDSWLKRLHSTANYGFCPNCDGKLDQTVLLPGDEDVPEDWETDDEAIVSYTCTRCGFSWYSSFPFPAVLHPAVVGVYHDHGIDMRETPFWNLDGLQADSATVTSSAPLRVEVTTTVGEQRICFTFDEDMNVVEERRD
ncbi:winged helix-turn-helix domain-containing protein [Halorussus aquaticus]|uniref:Winged helix-turn-helix domain-containing protein n=1 Tax=Halorussus aquaticus TaxID=2953748 RepID=A0ABD5PWV5_9EURY|nr:helix-turn-helix domain-containing protein [Halorussus aquaticus]